MPSDRSVCGAWVSVGVGVGVVLGRVCRIRAPRTARPRVRGRTAAELICVVRACLSPAIVITRSCCPFYRLGVNDVRGFQHRGIGPRAKEDALGGDAFWAVGANLYTPLPFESWRERCGENLQCHLFANAGACVATGAAPGAAAPSVVERLSQNTAVSLGLGLTAKMQNIQIELNYCFPVEFGPEDRPTPGLQFGAGFSFL